MHSSEQTKIALGREFPGWRFIHTDRGRWWALRGPLPRDRVHETDTVEADTPAQLRARLAEVTR